MGIPGLMSYFQERSSKFFRDYELHNTNLIIDGGSLTIELYNVNKLNWTFGGEYYKYGDLVNTFFEELDACGITPIVVFKGGFEDKKIRSIYKRAKDMPSNSFIRTTFNQQLSLPLLATDVFKQIIATRKIKCVMTLFKAEDHIASLAKIFNCPVLSSESDFFLYDVQYIPLNTVRPLIHRCTTGEGFVKRCKIFKTEFFLENFPNMNKSVLPLAAILLGNDYINMNVFKHFLISNIKIRRDSETSFIKNRLHLRIEAFFKCLEGHTLTTAVAVIIYYVEQEKRQQVLESFGSILNGYLNVSSTMLEPLGFTPEIIDDMMSRVSNTPFVFEKVVNSIKENIGEFNAEIINDAFDDDIDIECSCDEEENKLSEEEESHNITKPGNENDDIISIIPSWFIDTYKTAKFPGYFMDMLVRKLIIVADQVEDPYQPPCINISLKIIKVIFNLLSNGKTNKTVLRYIGREQKKIMGITNNRFAEYVSNKNHYRTIKTFEINCDDIDLPCDIPTLSELENLSRVKKKYIFDCTLGVSGQIILFPPEWRLFMASMKYWFDRTDKHYVTSYHIYSIVFLLVFHVIRKVFEYKSYFGRKVNSNQNWKPIVRDLTTVPIKQALRDITASDCMKAQSYFQSKMYVDAVSHPDIKVIHSFSLFQNTIKSAMYLNALLDTPYLSFNVADFYIGSLIYNIFADLRKYTYLHKRITIIFKDAPSILRLFVAILARIKLMLNIDIKISENTAE